MANTHLEPLIMLFGEDEYLRITVTDDDGADLTAATATVTITDASDVEVLTDEAMTGTGTTTRVFTILLTTGLEVGDDVASAGRYVALYKVTYGSQEIYFEQVITVRAVPTSFAGVYDWVYFLLPSVNEYKIDFIVSAVVAELLAAYPCFGGTYAGLSASNKTLFDKAAGFKAAWLLYNLPTTTSFTGSGEIKRKTQGDQTIEYAVGTTTTTTRGNVADWLTESALALAQTCAGTATNPLRRAKSSIPVSTLPNSVNPRDSLYPPDVERVAGE